MPIIGPLVKAEGETRVKLALQTIFSDTYPLESNLYKPLLLEIKFDTIFNLSPGIIFLKILFH